MPRSVLRGTSGAPYILQPSDIPVDGDLKFGHWAWVDFRAVDLSACDMRELDLIDCDGRGAILPPLLTGIYSRRSNFRNAVIPAALPVMNMHDIVAELIRQRGAVLTGADRTFAGLVRGYFVDASTGVVDYGASFGDLAHDLITNRGLSLAALRTRFVTLFAGYPRWIRRALFYLDNADSLIGSRPVYDDGAQVTVITSSGIRYLDLRPAFPGDADRIRVADRIATRLEAVAGEPFLVHVTQLDPYPVIEAIARSLVQGSPRAAWWTSWGAELDGRD